MKRISIIGMGALGLLYGSRIQDNAKEVSHDYVMDRKSLSVSAILELCLY